jgi:glycolate oxidase FAD binding subunit
MATGLHSIEQLRQQVLGAAAAGTALRLRGGGTKDWYGQRLEGELLDTRIHRGIVDYEPTELVITARCGTPLAEVEAVLAASGQMLAFEPPHFGEGATFGGAIACGLSGPRRPSSGALRDFVLGSVLMDGRGELLTFGGQVMKNVAGYDVSRLLAGSLGTLGLMLEHSVKVLPIPMREITLRFEMDEVRALQRLNEWGGQPLPISASCWHAGALHLRLSGADAALNAAMQLLGGEVAPDARAFWNGLREQRHGFFQAGGAVWRLSMPSASAAVILRGVQLIEWGGAQRWLRVDDEGLGSAHKIRSTVTAVGGHATLFRGGDKGCGVFQPLAPAIARIHQRLKAAFDPSGVFNPGRMY